MKTTSTDIEIKIPASIAALPLAINEKIVLAHIDRFPGSSNAQLAKLIGSSHRGAENLLRRLRQQGYVKSYGKGRARRHQLSFPVEHHIFSGADNAASSTAKAHFSCEGRPHPKLRTVRQELSLLQEFDESLAIINELCAHHDPFPEAIVSLYSRILKRIVDEAPESTAKVAAVKELTRCRDGFVAISFARRLPRKFQAHAARLIRTATPEKLAQFREYVETGQVSDDTPLLLTALGNVWQQS